MSRVEVSRKLGMVNREVVMTAMTMTKALGARKVAMVERRARMRKALLLQTENDAKQLQIPLQRPQKVSGLKKSGQQRA